MTTKELFNQSESDNKEFVLYDRIYALLKLEYSVSKSNKVGMYDEKISFTFDNEELINYLRSLYVNTKNSFVKKVVATVGKSKRVSERQLDIIVRDAMKYNLVINF